jgi:hypothetical protein
VERASELQLEERLTTAQRLLLELYLAALELPHVEPPEGHDAGPVPNVEIATAGFGDFDFYWEVYDPSLGLSRSGRAARSALGLQRVNDR